jgi:hypothetical protein
MIGEMIGLSNGSDIAILDRYDRMGTTAAEAGKSLLPPDSAF